VTDRLTTSVNEHCVHPTPRSNNRRRMRLRRKLLFLFALTSAFIVVVFGATAYQHLRNQQVEVLRDSVSQQLLGFDLALSGFFADVEGDVSSLVANDLVRSRDDSRFTSFLQADPASFTYDYTPLEQSIIRLFNVHRMTHPYVNSIYMGRENGSFVRSHPRERATRYDPRERPWYVQAKNSPQNVVRTAPYTSVTTPDVNIAIVKALTDDAGKVYGVVGMDVTVDALTSYVLNLRTHPTGDVFLVDRTGLILASHHTELRGKNLREYSPSLQSLLTGNPSGVHSLSILGRMHHVFHRTSTLGDWQLAVLVPTADIDSEIRRPVLWMVVSLSLGLVLLSGLTLWGLEFFVVQPLKKLTLETDRITRTGDLTRSIELPSRDEIGELATSYGNMVRALGRTQASLRDAEKHLTDYRDHLELMVAQRTRELEATLTQLATARDRAESADRLKSAFLATMSHELRTPLNSIIGFSGVLLQRLAGPLTEEQARQLGMVSSSADHLLALITDVLDLSRIEAGQLHLQVETFHLPSAIRAAVAAATPLSQKKNLELLVDIAASVGEVTSDRRRVEQILLNLLSNGIKFTDVGHVRVEALTRDGSVFISVTDTGIGIQEPELAQLFKPFTQLDSGIARRHEGTGLGLSISKKLAEMLGGTIWVKSQWGKGSQFGFTLPANGAMP
jgi:signal transduction histidine kinase